MSLNHSLKKILKVHEQEKTNVEKKYAEKRIHFEEEATRLYEALKKKEAAEGRYEKGIEQSVTINIIKQQSHYLAALNKDISTYQKRVQKARYEMESKQEELHEAYVEVKKFETVIENRREEFILKELRGERALMDEISLQQYMNKQAR